MFFLLTNTFINKYYPSLVTQLIISFVCYVLLILIIKDVIQVDNISDCKYYIMIFIIVDGSYLLYFVNKTKKISSYQKFINKDDKDEKIEDISDTKSTNLKSISLSSEMYDYKINHQDDKDSEDSSIHPFISGSETDSTQKNEKITI
jgi:hypothetical protein